MGNTVTTEPNGHGCSGRLWVDPQHRPRSTCPFSPGRPMARDWATATNARVPDSETRSTFGRNRLPDRRSRARPERSEVVSRFWAANNIFDFFDDGSETVLRSVPPIGTDAGGGDHVCEFHVLSPLFAELHPLHIQEPTLPASSSTVAFVESPGGISPPAHHETPNWLGRAVRKTTEVRD